MSDSLGPYGPKPTRLLCPWDSAGKNSGVGCHALLQGFFLTQGSNPCLLWLLNCRQSLYHWATGETLVPLHLSNSEVCDLPSCWTWIFELTRKNASMNLVMNYFCFHNQTLHSFSNLLQYSKILWEYKSLLDGFWYQFQCEGKRCSSYQ